jgi:hypothetical protein
MALVMGLFAAADRAGQCVPGLFSKLLEVTIPNPARPDRLRRPTADACVSGACVWERALHMGLWFPEFETFKLALRADGEHPGLGRFALDSMADLRPSHGKSLSLSRCH